MISAMVDVYLGVLLFLALWLGWKLYRNADEFDWRYRKSDLWLDYILDCVLWPLNLLLKPASLLKGSAFQSEQSGSISDISKRQAERMRRLEEMIKSPPPCGSQVKYLHDHWGESEAETIFNSADIESHFKGESPPVHSDAEAWVMVKFIKGRRDDWPHIEPIPEGINFEQMAFDLIDAGYGETICKLCNKAYPVSELSRTAPPMHGGWNTHTYSCPEGHQLFKHDYMHVMMRRD